MDDEDQAVGVPMIDQSGQVFAPTIQQLWDGVSLTFAALVYTALITIAGVLVASSPWWGLGLYAMVSLAIGFGAFFTDNGQRLAIEAAQRALRRGVAG